MGKKGREGTRGGRADTARSDKGTDNGMKMGSLRGFREQSVDKWRTMGETDGDGVGVAGAVSAQGQWDGWGWDTEKINDIVIST